MLHVNHATIHALIVKDLMIMSALSVVKKIIGNRFLMPQHIHAYVKMKIPITMIYQISIVVNVTILVLSAL